MEFFQDEKFLIPLLATLGASLAVIGMQIIAGYIRSEKKKIYTATYMLDVVRRILLSNLIITKHTITPHLVAIKRIVDGDKELLQMTLLLDDFDISQTRAISFSHLPNEYKLLVGYDRIEIIQAFQTILYLYEIDDNWLHLNEFVKHNLKNMHTFLTNDKERQENILYTYYDLLTTIEHEHNRVATFIVETIFPMLNEYIYSRQFILFSTSEARKIAKKITSVMEEYKDYIPETGYLEKVKYGGIQSEL